MSPAQLAPTSVDTPVDGAPSQTSPITRRSRPTHRSSRASPMLSSRRRRPRWRPRRFLLACRSRPPIYPMRQRLPWSPRPRPMRPPARRLARRTFRRRPFPLSFRHQTFPRRRRRQPLQSTTRPLGLADVPQPGASVGSAGPSGLPTEIDYSAIPRFLATQRPLFRRPTRRRPTQAMIGPLFPAAPRPRGWTIFISCMTERRPMRIPRPRPRVPRH